jgi:hypothetical protein
MSNSFADLVKKLNAISANEDQVSVTGEEVYKPVEEAVAGARETANILKAFSAIEKGKEKVVAEDKANEDVLGDIASRYRDFMKSEVAQGNDLTTVDSAVKEATSSATAIDDSFQKIFDMMGRLMNVTAEGAVLSKMVDREGGDAAWIADANEKLSAAYSALEEAHMYALPMSTEDE